MSVKRLRGEPEGFWRRLRWWVRQDYVYWDRVEHVERVLKDDPLTRDLTPDQVTHLAHRVARASR